MLAGEKPRLDPLLSGYECATIGRALERKELGITKSSDLNRDPTSRSSSQRVSSSSVNGNLGGSAGDFSSVAS